MNDIILAAWQHYTETQHGYFIDLFFCSTKCLTDYSLFSQALHYSDITVQPLFTAKLGLK